MKKFLSIFISLIIILSSLMVSVSAQEVMYEETRSEIDLSYLNVSVADGKSLKYDSRSGFIKKIVGNREKEKLDNLLETSPEYEKVLVDAMNQNTPIHVISVVDAPLVWKDDHYERVKKANSSFLSVIFNPLITTASAYEVAYGEESPHGHFLMAMMVSKQYNAQDERYEYKTLTTGMWDEHSVLGGSNYPANVEDLVTTTSPYGTVMTEHSILAIYANYKGDTREGRNTGDTVDFWVKEDGDNYCVYYIEDDPVWTWQLSYFMLSTTFVGDKSGTKKAKSQYVHTWKSIEFETQIKIPITTDDEKEPEIIITPKSNKEYWELSCMVTYDF